MSWREDVGGSKRPGAIAQNRSEDRETPNQHATRVFRAQTGFDRDHVVGVIAPTNTLDAYVIQVGMKHQSMPLTDGNVTRFIDDNLQPKDFMLIDRPKQHVRQIVVSAAAMELLIDGIAQPQRQHDGA